MATYKGKEIDLTPTSSMASAAQRALDWRKEHNRGGTSVGVARARQLVNRTELSPRTVRRMKSFFARHEVDKQAEGFNSDEEGFPSAGRIAWDLWGGDAGKTWADRKTEQLDRIDEGKSMDMEKAFTLLAQAGAQNGEVVSDPNTGEHVNIPDEDGAKSYDKGTYHEMTVTFEVKNFGDEDEYFSFQGYGATFGNVDLGGDRVARGAFEKTIKQYMNGTKRLPVLWQHDTRMPLGIYTELSEDSNGLFVKGRMPKEDAFVRDRVIPQMKTGSITAMSIGYVVNEVEYTNDVRELKEVELMEISLVTMPMNPQAQITGMKRAVPQSVFMPLADRSYRWDETEALKRVQEFTGSQHAPSARYKSAFLYYNADKADEFDGYSMLICDVIDGELKTVAAALMAAAAALNNEMSGTPDSMRLPVMRVVEKHYANFGMETPFKDGKSFRIDDLDTLTERQLEKLLKSGVYFSHKTAKMIVSALKERQQRDVDGVKARDADEKKALSMLLDFANNLQKREG